MVKRLPTNPPLTVAVIGTGETDSKNIEALLNDFTSPYEEVAFILPVDDAHFTDDLGVIAEWLAANDLPYVAVTDGSAPGKGLVSVLEGADSTQKVARVSTKMVQLLQAEAAEGNDVRLLVLWDDDDSEAVTAVNKALAAGIPALNLCDGLDPFSFDDEDGPLPDDEASAEENDQHLIQEGKEPNSAFKPADEYDDWGVRKLRAALREHPNKGMNDRAIGQLEKDPAIIALRTADAAKANGDAPENEVEETDEAPAKAAATTRARRAFAEGAAEGTGDEAQASLPRSRGGDVLVDQEDAPEATESVAPSTMVGSSAYGDEIMRRDSLDLAVRSGAPYEAVLPLAMKFEVYLRGERQSAGRPRADGSPAQAREINPDTGKAVRRRGSHSTE